MKSLRQTAREALLDAFAELALSRRYNEFGVGSVARKANVARSTFYYHFKAKDDLLIHNLKPMMSALARLLVSAEPTQEVTYWVDHIWEHRVGARRIFETATARKIADALSIELQATLETMMTDPPARRLAPLLADQIAASMLSLLRAWTKGRAAAAPSDIARMLWTTAHALANSNWRPA